MRKICKLDRSHLLISSASPYLLLEMRDDALRTMPALQSHEKG